jgi:hypothetical protein
MVSSSITNNAHTTEDNAYHPFLCGSPGVGNDLLKLPNNRMHLSGCSFIRGLPDWVSKTPWSLYVFKNGAMNDNIPHQLLSVMRNV